MPGAHPRRRLGRATCSAPTLRALAFAQATSPATLRAVKVADDADADPLPAEWVERGLPIPLVMIESPFRETVRPMLRYVRQLRRENPGDVISIIIPEYVVGHWWENLLHNQTALRLKGRLLFEPSVTVTSVPWVLGGDRDGRRHEHQRADSSTCQARDLARRGGAAAAPGPRSDSQPRAASSAALALARDRACRC